MLLKCIIQIPCFNEEVSLPTTLAALPRSLQGVDCVEWLVIDDGSSDHTAEIAKWHGVEHVIRLTKNQGLARAFMIGIEACLKKGADIIVNTDADNQYHAGDIEKLIVPIIEKKADMVIGTRPIDDIKHFSFSKKLLQKIGSLVVRFISRADVKDASSGFRAISRTAAKKICVFSDYTYTLETIIQASRNGTVIASVPVRTNEYLRPSRLVKNSLSYVFISAVTIARMFVVYNPFKFFSTLALLNFLAGILIGVRFLILLTMGMGQGHIQSLILCTILIIAAILLFTIAILADLIAINRQLLEKIDLHLKLLNEEKDIN
ncbi:MAG TPA: glycosyltransferase family 2 protein [Candidatus Brocadiaceae bacterium]